MTLQLSDAIYSEITALCRLGDKHVVAGEFELAKEKYLAALDLVPENHEEWEAATWIYVAIGDTHFRMNNYERALKCFINAVQCPKGMGNPYIHLRLGQLYYELGNLEKAADELTRAYMGAGLKIFLEDDPKYLEFLETQIEI